MRIDQLDLIAFGPFTDRALDLSAGDPGLHVIYGDNEAGKSSSLRALTQWLFGIPLRSTDNFLHDYAQLRVGGRLRSAAGESLSFVRRKANKDSLCEPGSGAVLPEERLASYLGAIDEELFTKLYGIDHGRLVAGGHEILMHSGDVGQALFSAASGVSNLREVLSGLESEAGELFKPRKSSSRVNRALAAYKAAQADEREARLSTRDYVALRKELDEHVAALATVEGERAQEARRLSRLERVIRVQGALGERRGVLAKLAELASAPVLPEGFSGERRELEHQLRSHEEALGKAEVRLATCEERLDATSVREELLRGEEQITSLFKQLGAVEKALADRPRHDGQRRLLRNKALKILQRLGPDLGLEAVAELRPALKNQAWLQDLAAARGLLLQQKEQAAKARRDAEERRAAALEQLASLGERRDVSGLKADVQAGRKAGDLDAELVEAEARAAKAEELCARGFERLGRFSGSPEIFSALEIPLPESETIDRFEQSLDAQEARARDLEREGLQLARELDEQEQELHSLLATADVPSLDDLSEARGLREEVWRRVRGTYIDAPESGKGADDDGALPGRYEGAVRQADQLADRLREDADKVQRRAILEQTRGRLAERKLASEEAAREVERARDALVTEWNALWERLGIEPASPREMRAWRSAALRLRDQVDARATALAAVARAREQLQGQIEALAAAIAAVAPGESPQELRALGREVLLQRAEGIVERELALVARAEKARETLAESDAVLARAAEEARSRAGSEASWSGDWAKATAGLGLGAEPAPVQALEAMKVLQSFVETFDQADDLERRIYGMDQDVERFEARVDAFAGEIGQARAGEAAFQWVARLHQELRDAREAQAARRKLVEERRELSEEIQTTGLELRSGRKRLAELCELAGVGAPQELSVVEERVATRTRVRIRAEELDRELSRTGDGLSVEDLEAEFAGIGIDVDLLAEERDAAQGAVSELEGRRDALRDRRRDLERGLASKDGGAVAAEARAAAEQHLAEAATGAEAYLRLRVAALLLGGQIEAYRKANQGPVLRRAAEIFARLTLGSFKGLRDDLDAKGQPVLFGVRPDDKEVPVAGMSDGTGDQLFLALRLATLEQHLAKGEPMPFIVDDILVGFDDQRSQACLEVLGELAAKTQVLLFTHHSRIRELAEGVRAPAGVFVHDLTRP